MDEGISEAGNRTEEEQGPTTARTGRRRRTAREARREILDAARRRLLDGGPDNVRLQRIGQDVGLSHSSILHHFGSRDGLMAALREEAFEALGRDLAERLARPGGPFPSADFFERIAETLGDEGYARLLAWQLMAGNSPEPGRIGHSVLGPPGSDGLIRGLAAPFHERRCEWASRHGLPTPDEEESRWLVAYICCTLLGEALAGHIMMRSAGLDPSPEARRRLRARFAELAEAIAFPVPGRTGAGAGAGTGPGMAESGIHPIEPGQRSADGTG